MLDSIASYYQKKTQLHFAGNITVKMS